MRAPTLGSATGGDGIGGSYAAAAKRGQARCGSEAELYKVVGSPPRVHDLVEGVAGPSVEAVLSKERDEAIALAEALQDELTNSFCLLLLASSQ